MKYIGDFALNSTLNFKFPTQSLAGGPITLAGTPVVKVYKDGATTTEVTTGVTLSVDHDGLTGLHNVEVVMTDAFYAAGHDYTAVITTGTVDGISVVGKPIATWSIENRQTAPVLAAVLGIGTAGGAAINTDAATDNYGGGITGVTSGTTKVGTETGTYANTSNVNGVYHVMTHSGNAIDIVYQFLCGGGTSPVSAKWTGYLNSSNDTVTVYAWNHGATHGGPGWEQVGTIAGQNTTVNLVKDLTLYARHMGTSAAELGKVYLRFACTGMTAPVLNTDQVYVSYAVTSRSVGYSQGLIWIDTVHGTAGSEAYVNGTADKPVNNYADAELLENALGTPRFHVAAGSTLTISGLVNDLVDHEFYGDGWTLVATNSLDITNAHIEGATISGSTTGDGATLVGCRVGTLTIAAAEFKYCTLLGTISLVASKNYNFISCDDDDATTTSQPIITFAASNNVGMRKYSGGLEIASFVATDYLTCDGAGRLIVGSTCSANPNGNITLRGPWASVTDNVSGGFKGTITQTQRLSSADTIADAVWDEVLTTGHAVSNSAAAVVNALVANTATAVWGATSRTLSGFGTLVADIATAVWGAAIRTLTAGGLSASDVWAYATRSLTDKTGFALTSAYDAAKTAAQPGADADTLKTLSDQLDLIGAAAGEVEWEYTVKVNGVVQPGALVKLYSDAAYTILIQSGVTLASGIVTFHITAAQYAAKKYLKIYPPGIAVQFDVED